MKILDFIGRKYVFVNQEDYSKAVLEISDKLTYLDPSHKEESTEDIEGLFEQIKNYPELETENGFPYKFSDVKQTTIYITNVKHKAVIDVTEAVKNYPDFSKENEGISK